MLNRASRRSRLRRVVGRGLLAVSLLLVAVPSALGSTPTSPMSWWGYWSGVKGDAYAGARFIRKSFAKRYKTNVVLIHAPTDPALIPTVKTALEQAQAKDLGVVLMLDALLRKPSNPCGYFCNTGWVYDANDYAGWNERLQGLADGLGSAKQAIVAVVGFDEVNVYGSLGFQHAAGQPSPISYSMELAAQYFPEATERGHIWMTNPDGGSGVQTPPNPTTLEGSTLVFAYYYPDFIGPFNPTTVPFCPHEGTYPGATPPAGSFLALDDSALSNFVANVNAARPGEANPIVYIPYSNRGGRNPPTAASRGTACHLESLWQYVHCKAASEPTGWAGQVRGFVAWQWDPAPEVRDEMGNIIDPGWTGTKSNSLLKKAGRWIGRERVTPTVPCP